MSRPGNANLVIDAEMGPTLRAAMDVLELAAELVELVPDWHEPQQRELKARCEALMQLVIDRLHGKMR